MSRANQKRRKQDDRLEDPGLWRFNSSTVEQLALELMTRNRNKGGPNPLGQAIAVMAARGGMTHKDLKAYMDVPRPPSFSNAIWMTVAQQFNLNQLGGVDQLRTFSVPALSLPPSFHRELIRLSAKWLNVYRGRAAHDTEAARVRFMDAWYVPVCALFKGRLVDLPESQMPATPRTSGGSVEHEVYMVEGIMLLVFEMKMGFSHEKDALGQIMLELDSAYIKNSNRFNTQPPVYGILSDLRTFYFLRYDGAHFTRATTDIHVTGPSRIVFLDGMRKVSDQLFSILLEGFISTLRAVVNRSHMRGIIGDVSEHNSAQEGNEILKIPRGKRPSLDKWTQVLILSEEAQNILTRRKAHNSMEQWEDTGTQGLERLSASMSLLTRIGDPPDLDIPGLNNEADIILTAALLDQPVVHHETV